MNAELKYKLTALGFFFCLSAAFYLQFVHPYTLAVVHEKPVLHNNLWTVLPVVVALVFYIFQLHFYRSVQHRVKIFPLVGSGILLVLLIAVQVLNRAENLDDMTRRKIMDHHATPGIKESHSFRY